MTEVAAKPNQRLTSGRVLARNTIWNLLSSGAPMLVALICIPILIRDMGKPRFGVLTLAWALIGYASLFDLGLGRALTQVVAQRLGDGREHEIPSLTWTSLILMLALGVAGGVLVLLGSPWLVAHGLNIPSALQRETVSSFRLLGMSIPFVITTAGLRGLLEAHQRFRLISALRIPMGVFTFAGPLLVLPFSRSLVPVVAILVAARIIAWAAFFWVCLAILPELRRTIAWERGSVGPLLRFGGWTTISNVVSPIMATLDRFVIGAVVSVTAVTYYATPWEMVTKLSLVPAALIGVIFPAFSATFMHNAERTALLFRRTLTSIFIALFPVTLCALALGQDALRLWLGADFAQHSYRILQVLSVGVLLNSLAQVPFWLLQGVGRPHLTAILHLIELPLYVGLLWWLVTTHGSEGAAIAWSARMTVDAVLLFAVAGRFLPRSRELKMRGAFLPAMGFVALALAALVQGLILKVAFLSVMIPCFAVVTWFWILTPEERALAQIGR